MVVTGQVPVLMTGMRTSRYHPFVRVYEEQGIVLRLRLPCFLCAAPEEMGLLRLKKSTSMSLAFSAPEASVAGSLGRVFCSALSFTMRVSVSVQFFLLWLMCFFFCLPVVCRCTCLLGCPVSCV